MTKAEQKTVGKQKQKNHPKYEGVMRKLKKDQPSKLQGNTKRANIADADKVTQLKAHRLNTQEGNQGQVKLIGLITTEGRDKGSKI